MALRGRSRRFAGVHHTPFAQRGVSLTAVAGTQILLMSTAEGAADGATMASMTELSNGRHPVQATAARRPIMRRTGAHTTPNGSPAIEFDGNDDWMSGALPGAGVISTSQGLMVYLYFKQISLTNSSAFDAQQLFDCGAGGGILELVADTSVDIAVGWPDDFVGVNTGVVRDTFGASQTGWQLLTFEFIPPPAVGAGYKAYRGGVQIGVTETNWQFTDIATGYGFGNSAALNTGWRGALAHLQVVNAWHDSPTRSGIEAAILAEYAT